MPLTHSPDPVHLGPGAGTAADQSAVPQWFADQSDGIGWNPAAVEDPDAFGWPEPPPSGWAFFALSGDGVWNWGDGTADSPASVDPVSHVYAADGPYTVTYTSPTAGTTTVLVKQDRSASRPILTSMAPFTISASGPPVDVVMTTANVLAGASVLVGGVRVPATQVDATHFQFTYDPAVLTGPVKDTVWMVNPDNGATEPQQMLFTT
jgi:hypothetical protein